VQTAQVPTLSDTGLFVSSRWGAAAVVEAAKDAERLGFAAGAFVGETGLMGDPLVAAGAAAAATRSLPVGVAMVNVWRMLPSTLASAVRSLADLAPGRLSVTLGPWHEPLARQAGAVRHHPVAAMTEATAIVRSLLRGERCQLDGSVFACTGADLGREPVQVPLLWGVMGPKLVTAAGRHADGVAVNYAASVDRVGGVISQARRSAMVTDRDPDRLAFPAYVVVSLDDDGEVAVDRVRTFFESSPVMRREAGLPTKGSVSADTVATLSACGTSAQVRTRLDEYLGAGATSVVLAVVGQQVDQVARAVAENEDLGR
jgi:5,10-methylenetetrahydromethanopterin reductase